MATITVEVTIVNGGMGGIFVNIDKTNFQFTTSGKKSIDLAPNLYIATVTGTEPTGTQVTVEIFQGSTRLIKKVFSNSIFAGSMPFTVI